MKNLLTALILLVSATLVACSGGGSPEPTGTELIEDPAPRSGKADGPFDEGDDTMWATIAARCTPPADDEPVIYSNEFSWGYTQETMKAKFEEMYASDKRLSERAYFDDETGNFILPTYEGWGGEVILSRRLVENVTMHIEKALLLGYADFVFFPDMGHSHFFVPEDHWEEHYRGTPVSGIADRNTKLFEDPELKVLYHTAEQLEMLDDNNKVLDDPWVQWRYHTRNPVGDNDWQGRIDLLREYESAANTSRNYPGHHYHGAGFNLSANKDGCFPYRAPDGQLFWYDISLEDLPYDTSNADPYDGGL